MKNLTLTICLTLAILLGSMGTSWGADYQKGLAAAKSGDFATALREFRPLAGQGYANAQNNLGVMYRKGLGVPQDYKTAMKWFTLAAEQGYANAQSNLGWMHEEGLGVPKDYKTAVKWYTLAAEQRDAKGQLLLGFMYGLGQGVLKDPVYAYMWGHIAASNGNENGRKLQDFVSKKMTPTQIEKAQELARECVAKKYKGC